MAAPASSDLWWTAHGAGPTCVLVHGGLGLDHSYLLAGCRALGDRLRLVAYDQRGCGRSPDPENWSTAEFSAWVEDLAGVIAAQATGPVIVIGHSFGGMVALAHALTHPEQVAALVLCGTYPAFDFAEEAVGRALARASDVQREALLAGLAAPFPDQASFVRFFDVALPLYLHQATAAQLAVLAEMRLRFAAMNCTLHRWVPTLDFTARLPEVVVPTLVLTGADDWCCPVERTVARFEAGIPDATRADFPASGHFPFLEEPERFRAVVTGWLEARGLLPHAEAVA